MHHTSQLTDKCQKKLVLCHVTQDTPVTLVTESLPEKSEHKLKLKNLVAVWGLRVFLLHGRTIIPLLDSLPTFATN